MLYITTRLIIVGEPATDSDAKPQDESMDVMSY